MKAIRLGLKSAPLAALVLVMTLLAGCQTSKPKDWNKAVGSYTYDQAARDLGGPILQTKTAEGGTQAEWTNLRLTFGTDGRLSGWQKLR